MSKKLFIYNVKGSIPIIAENEEEARVEALMVLEEATTINVEEVKSVKQLKDKNLLKEIPYASEKDITCEDYLEESCVLFKEEIEILREKMSGNS